MLRASSTFIRSVGSARSVSVNAYRRAISIEYEKIYGHNIPASMWLSTAKNMVYYHMLAVEHDSGEYILDSYMLERVRAYLMCKGPVDPDRVEIEYCINQTRENDDMATKKSVSGIETESKKGKGLPTRPNVEGITVSALCKSMGAMGYGVPQATAVIAELFPEHAKNVMPATITTGLSDGRRPEKRGPAPTLPGTLEARVRRIADAVKVEKSEKVAKTAPAKAPAKSAVKAAAKPAAKSAPAPKKKVVRKLAAKRS